MKDQHVLTVTKTGTIQQHQLIAIHAIRQIMLTHRIQNIRHLVFLQFALSAIQPILTGNLHHTASTMQNRFRYIQANIGVNGQTAINAIQILQITQYSAVLTATNIIKQVWIASTEVKMDIHMTAPHV